MTAAISETEYAVDVPFDGMPDSPSDVLPEGLAAAEPATAAEPAPTPRRKPGPPPNPRSGRQSRLAKKAAAPAKRTTPNKPAAAPPEPEPDNPMEVGALTMLGWVAKPCSIGALALKMRASRLAEAAEKCPPGAEAKAEALMRRAVTMDVHGQALSLDAMTLYAHRKALVKGAAQLGEHIDWVGAGLQKAAVLSPYAAFSEAVAAIALQVAVNHGLMPVLPGTMAPAELHALVEAAA